MVRLTGNMATNAGVAIACGTAIYFPTSVNATETTAAGLGTADTSNSSGVFQCLTLAANKYDIRVNCGSAFRWSRYADEIQHATYQTGDGCVCGLEGNLYFGIGNDAGMRWSIGDASNHAFVIGIGDTSRQMHITTLGAMATDWARLAGTHPELAIHSNTTPATDYLAIGNHDGTSAFINVAGGTELSLQLAGAEYLSLTTADTIFNEGGNDVDLRVEGANNANLLTLDGGTDSLGLGGAVTTGAFISLTPASQTRDMVSAVGSWLHIPADSQDINAAGNCATIAVGAAVYLGVPTWTSTATGLTLTDSATLHIAGKPVDSTNVTNTREYGILVECGGIGLGIPGGTTGCLRFGGGTSGVVTMTVAAAAGTWSLTLPTGNGCALQFLQTDGCGVTTWATPSATCAASQAEQEAACITNKYTSPGTQKFHPGTAKVWVGWEQCGAHSITSSYNMTSVTDGGAAGETDHLWDVDFSGANYAFTGGMSEVVSMTVTDASIATTGATTTSVNACGAGTDAGLHNSMAVFGDQ